MIILYNKPFSTLPSPPYLMVIYGFPQYPYFYLMSSISWKISPHIFLVCHNVFNYLFMGIFMEISTLYQISFIKCQTSPLCECPSPLDIKTCSFYFRPIFLYQEENMESLPSTIFAFLFNYLYLMYNFLGIECLGSSLRTFYI